MGMLYLLLVLYGLFILVLPVLLYLVWARIGGLQSRIASLEAQQRKQVIAPVAPRQAGAPVEPGPSVAAPAMTASDTPPQTATPVWQAEEQAEPVPALDEAPFAPATPTAATTSTARDAGFGAPPPQGPSLTQRIHDWLFGGNTVARVGVIVLFFGVAFLLKYTAELGLVPIELRLVGVVIGGMLLLAIGWRLRERRAIYARLMQGGGCGVIYLTIFASVTLYKFMSPLTGLGVMVVMVALTCMLALLQNARGLAVLAVVGGFLAPILVSTGSGDHVVLFSYYAILNAGIVGIAWYRPWRELNLLGFVFTFVIGSLWGYKYYTPQHFASTEPFLILFFVFYVAVAVLFGLRRQSAGWFAYVDGTIVFGTPIIGFGLQAAMVSDFEYGNAFSAIAVGLFYAILASALWRRRQGEMRRMVESFVALAVVFATLAVPMILDGRWTGATWAIEGAAVLWIGAKQHRFLPRLFGLLVQFAAGTSFLLALDAAVAARPVLNAILLGAVLIALAGLVSAYVMERYRDNLAGDERSMSYVVLAWGLLWWFGAGLREIDEFVVHRHQLYGSLLFVTLSIVSAVLVAARINWTQMRYVLLLQWPAMLIATLYMVDSPATRHPLQNLGLLAWPVALVAGYWLLHRVEQWDERWTQGKLLRTGHMLTLWLVLLLLAWEAWWQLDHTLLLSTAWSAVSWGIVPGLLMFVLLKRGAALRWPVGQHAALYRWNAALPVMIALALWCAAAVTLRGTPTPLPYLTVLNPVELSQLLLLALVYDWLRQADNPYHGTAMRFGLGVSAFVVLNGIIARSVHHYAGVRHDFDAMVDSATFQTSISITWTLLALSIMIMSTRRGSRFGWFVGGGLLGVVVAKLFFIDLSAIGTVARIISFIVVGVLIILVGYFSPLPPANREEGKA